MFCYNDGKDRFILFYRYDKILKQGGALLDIRVLQNFLTVAREESITKAAEILHMTQPPLSRQIKELEQELGRQLLVREPRRVTLTEAGKLLCDRAEELIALMDKTVEQIRDAETLVAGDIYLGGGESENMLLLAQIAQKLQVQYPRIKYRIYSGDADRVRAQLEHGLLDFALLVHPADTTKYDYLSLPVTDTWGVMMRHDSPLAKQTSVSPRDLWDKPLLFSHQTAGSSEMARFFKRDFSQLNVIATYDLIYNASRFVKAGLGYAVVLDKLMRTEETDTKDGTIKESTSPDTLCFRPFHPPLHAALCVAWKKQRTFSRAGTLFLQQLQKELNVSTNPECSASI